MKSTYKPYETEEYLDFYCFRPLAGILVRKVLYSAVTPQHLTLLCLVCGALASGILYVSMSWVARIAVVGLLVVLSVLDCADGQLARARRVNSLSGRVLDGSVDYLVFAAVYLAVYFRLVSYSAFGDGTLLVVLLAAGSHAVHTACFDYYRNEYLLYVRSDYKSEASSPQMIREEIEGLRRTGGARYLSVLLWMYYGYTVVQERLARKQVLTIPVGVSELYRRYNQRILRMWSFLGSSSHVFFLMLFVLAGSVSGYLVFVIFLNLYHLFVFFMQWRAQLRITKALALLTAEDVQNSPLR